MTCAKREKPRQARAPGGYHIDGATRQLGWRRAAPDPPTRRLARWEVVLRLHTRHAMRTGLSPTRVSALAGDRVFPSHPLDGPAAGAGQHVLAQAYFLLLLAWNVPAGASAPRLLLLSA